VCHYGYCSLLRDQGDGLIRTHPLRIEGMSIRALARTVRGRSQRRALGAGLGEPTTEDVAVRRRRGWTGFKRPIDAMLTENLDTQRKQRQTLSARFGSALRAAAPRARVAAN